MTIDVLPTIAELTGSDLPTGEIDGLSIVSLVRGEKLARSPHEALFFWYHDRQLQAMRMGQWKLHFPHGYRSLQGRVAGNNGLPAKYTYKIPIELSLFDLRSDPGETSNVASKHPKVTARMLALAEQAKARLGDTLTDIPGSAIRGPGKLSALE